MEESWSVNNYVGTFLSQKKNDGFLTTLGLLVGRTFGRAGLGLDGGCCGSSGRLVGTLLLFGERVTVSDGVMLDSSLVSSVSVSSSLKPCSSKFNGSRG